PVHQRELVGIDRRGALEELQRRQHGEVGRRLVEVALVDVGAKRRRLVRRRPCARIAPAQRRALDRLWRGWLLGLDADPLDRRTPGRPLGFTRLLTRSFARLLFRHGPFPFACPASRTFTRTTLRA